MLLPGYFEGRTLNRTPLTLPLYLLWNAANEPGLISDETALSLLYHRASPLDSFAVYMRPPRLAGQCPSLLRITAKFSTA
jgi:hypothetical protein